MNNRVAREVAEMGYSLKMLGWYLEQSGPAKAMTAFPHPWLQEAFPSPGAQHHKNHHI